MRHERNFAVKKKDGCRPPCTQACGSLAFPWRTDLDNRLQQLKSISRFILIGHLLGSITKKKTFIVFDPMMYQVTGGHEFFMSSTTTCWARGFVKVKRCISATVLAFLFRCSSRDWNS